MKRRKLKQMTLGLIIATNILFLAACGSANNAGITTESKDQAAAPSYGMETADMAISTEESAIESQDSTSLESQAEVINDTSQISGQKLIKDVSMSVETRTFDDFLTELTSQIANLGGYVENSDVSGGSYQYDNYRTGYITARIPEDRLEGFVKIVKEKGNVIRTSEQTTDVTLQYVDIESRLKALKIEQETLMNLLENAANMEDIIAIQSQLTQVRYEIESKESQIRTYDNLVNYSTVRIDITEVERETPIETETFASEIKAKFSNNLYSIKEGFLNFVIEFIAALPYIVVWAVIIFIFSIGGRKIYKKYTSKKAMNHFGSNINEEINKDDNKEEK